MLQQNPLRKTQGLIIERMGDDQLIYHSELSQAFHLNATLGQIWELCDGNRTVAQMCDQLPHLPAENRSEAVQQGLQQLANHGLLQNAPRSAVSRRTLLKGLGRAAVAAPLLTMVAVPAAAAAASAGANPCANCGGINPPCPLGCACTTNADCQSANCNLQKCAPPT